MSKLPEWHCRDEADRKYLEEWTNKKLDERHKAEAEEIAKAEAAFLGGRSKHLTLEQWEIAFIEYQFLEATARKDQTHLERLFVNYPQVASKLWLARRSGKPKRLFRTPIELFQFRASRDMDLIHQIWKKEFGRQNRSAPPTAKEIAVRRNLPPGEVFETWMARLDALKNRKRLNKR